MPRAGFIPAPTRSLAGEEGSAYWGGYPIDGYRHDELHAGWGSRRGTGYLLLAVADFPGDGVEDPGHEVEAPHADECLQFLVAVCVGVGD